MMKRNGAPKKRGTKNSLENTKRLAVCAALAALGVVVIYLGSFLDVLSASMCVIASLFCVIAVIEYGKIYPWLVYAVTAALSVILLPKNEAAWIYLAFFGFYPILKEKFERSKGLNQWIFKELVFNAALILLLLGEKFILMPNTTDPWWIYVAVVVLAEIVFPVYDLALTRLITVYIVKLRSRLRIK